MSGFSASDAALEGFRLTRERPGTVLIWSVLNSIALLFIGGAMLLSLGRPFVDYMKKGGFSASDTEALGDMLARSWPAFLLIMVLVVLLLSVLTAGVYRLVLRPSEAGFVHLRLGADELRLALINLLLFGVGVLYLVVTELVVAGAESVGGGGAAVLAAFLMLIPGLWLGVRLSLATPMSFAERHMSLREAWRLTYGHFWPLLGMIVLAFIFYVIIWILMALIISPLVTLAGGPVNLLDLGRLSLLELVVGVISLAGQIILPILQWIIIYAPLAVAYRDLHGDTRLPAAGAA